MWPDSPSKILIDKTKLQKFIKLMFSLFFRFGIGNHKVPARLPCFIGFAKSSSIPWMYRDTSPIRHRSIRWIATLKYKNVSLIRHHAPTSNAFPVLRIGAVKAWCFPVLFIQSPKLNSYFIRRYSLKCWPVRFTYKAPSLIRPVHVFFILCFRAEFYLE